MDSNKVLIALLTLVLLFHYSLTESTTLAHNQHRHLNKEEKQEQELSGQRRGSGVRRSIRCDPFYLYLYGYCGQWPFPTYRSPNNPFDQTPPIFPPPFRYFPRPPRLIPPPLVPSPPPPVVFRPPLIIPPPMPLIFSPPPSPWWLSSPPPPQPWWYSSSPPPPSPDPIPWYIQAPPPPPPEPIPWYIPAPPPPLV